jgi:protein-S-isoprenylcysteine O-methyltransferase Ste14
MARQAANPRLPDLGPRGEGWVAGQFILLGLLVVLGLPGLRNLGSGGVIGWMWSALGAGALMLGAWLVVRAFVDLGPSMTPLPRPRTDGRVVESGIYARLRHPIYAGLILGSLGWSALTRSPASLVVALALAAFLDAKARREEAWLLDRYPPYAAYRLRTKRFLPGLY